MKVDYRKTQISKGRDLLNSYFNEILSQPSVECLDFGDEYDDVIQNLIKG